MLYNYFAFFRSLNLQVFVRDFIRNVYLGQVLLTIESDIGQVTKGNHTFYRGAFRFKVILQTYKPLLLF
jgi:hypothetical protein